MVRIRCLAALKNAIGGQGEVSVSDAVTVKKAIEALSRKYGDEFTKRIFDETGQIKRYIAIQVNEKDIRHLNGLETKVMKDDEIVLLPVVAGG